MKNRYPVGSPIQLTEYVRALRKARGETQADVAKKLGVSTMRVAAMEKDLGRVSTGRVITLLQLLGARLELTTDGPVQSQERTDGATEERQDPPRRKSRSGEW